MASMSHAALWPLNHNLKIFYAYALNCVSAVADLALNRVFTFGNTFRTSEKKKKKDKTTTNEVKM